MKIQTHYCRKSEKMYDYGENEITNKKRTHRKAPSINK